MALIATIFLIQACSYSIKQEDYLLPLPDDKNMNLDGRIDYLTNLINDDDKAEFRYERAKLYLKADRNPAALRDINRAISLNTKNVKYYVVKAKADLSESNYKEALEAAQHAEKNGISSPELSVLLGELFYQDGNQISALRYLQEALVNLPNNFDAIYLSGKIYAEQKDTAAAFNYLEKAIKIDTTAKDPYITYMSLLNDYKMYKQSASIGNKYLQAIKPDAAFSYYYAETLENNRQADSSLVWYEKSFTEQNHWKPGIKLARARLKDGDYREAMRLYKICLSQNPSIENGFYELGYINEYLLGDLNEALKAYQSGEVSDTTSTRYPFYVKRVQRKIEFKNFQESF
ncbi:tetratricopeptide repeat protein [Chondrinema litorale]|uniref:tetratricopeptide repeat protein n=1 Tax=Chondrinema litorale TaxID=2994555 RepID=UPI00254275F9|nr:tetratricopeptide repeat protein [Chondrinema litorale]UZR94005.1 tetratricopeptide repeat protein [Chondrinema litorale]